MRELKDLHSNMVRFIIDLNNEIDNISKRIYIPIWLDLLYILKKEYNYFLKNLHSNMVRFII